MTEADMQPKRFGDEDRKVQSKIVQKRDGWLANLFYRLTGRASVSRSWSRDPKPRLEFDLGELTLNGVGVGQSARRLGDLRLGPATEVITGEHQHFDYDDLGLVIMAFETRGICEFVLHWYTGSMADSSFPGKMLFHGREVPLSAESTRADVEEMFGTPTNVEEDKDEDYLCLEYKVDKGELSFVFNEDGTVSFANGYAAWYLAD